MKKKWLGIRVIVSMCAALGWWGFLYPELSLTPDTVAVKVEDENGTTRTQSPEWSFDSSLFWDLLNAGQGKITFKSKLLTGFSLFFGGDS